MTRSGCGWRWGWWAGGGGREGLWQLPAEVAEPGRMLMSPERTQGFLARCRGQVTLRRAPRTRLRLEAEEGQLELATADPRAFPALQGAAGTTLPLRPAELAQLSGLLGGLAAPEQCYVLPHGQGCEAVATDRWVLAHTTLGFAPMEAWRVPGELCGLWDQVQRAVVLPATRCLRLRASERWVHLQWPGGLVGVQPPRVWPGIPYRRFLELPCAGQVTVGRAALAAELQVLLRVGLEPVSLASDGTQLVVRGRSPEAEGLGRVAAEGAGLRAARVTLEDRGVCLVLRTGERTLFLSATAGAGS